MGHFMVKLVDPENVFLTVFKKKNDILTLCTFVSIRPKLNLKDTRYKNI